jgi:hypothetical protein
MIVVAAPADFNDDLWRANAIINLAAAEACHLAKSNPAHSLYP